MRSHDTYARDSSLRKLTKVNRWLLAASVALTGLFAEAAAHAFPGKSTARAASTAAKHTRARSVHHHAAPTHTQSLSPPQQPPQATTESVAPEEPTAAPDTAPAEAPTPEESAPVEEPARKAEPAQAVEPPVVSGGS